MYVRPVFFAFFIAGMALPPTSAQTPPAAPALSHIVSAEVEELTPFQLNIARRGVRFRIQMAAPPVCGPGSGRHEYGFLVDADKSDATGATDPAFGNLGIDARVVMRCDENSGRFLSPLGRVTVRAGQSSPGLDLVTTAGLLPSIDFLWVPYSAFGNQLSLPAAPLFRRWAIFERSIP